MRVLITGAAGFVGVYLLRELLGLKEAVLYAGVLNESEAADLEERFADAVRERRLHILQADITDAGQVMGLVRGAMPEGIIHLAAQASVALSFREPLLTRRINVDGTENLLTAVVENQLQPRILLIGSADQYGNVPEERQPICEEEPLQPNSPYGESKAAQEELARVFREQYGLEIVIVRAAPHTGPGQRTAFVIPDWCAQIRQMNVDADLRGAVENDSGMKTAGRPHVLTVGNLNVIRDMSDVRDVVRAYVMLLRAQTVREVYNVGSGKGIRLAEIPQKIAACAGIEDLQVKVDPQKCRPAEIACLVVDNKRLREDTGWKPVFTLEQTIRDILHKI